MESVANRIRLHRESLVDLKPLDLDPKLKKIYGKFSGDELLIINEFHQSRGFRKIHIEIAKFGPALEILHCVFFPDPRFDLPIFGVDVVSSLDAISAAIVDLSPVGDALPESIERSLSKLDFPNFKHVRKLPDWGDIFSNYVQFIRPDSNKEVELFKTLVDEFLNVLISTCSLTKQELPDSAITIERYARQKFYCLQQKRNDKTRNVLAKTFSPHWAEEYIDMVLFSCPDGYLDHSI